MRQFIFCTIFQFLKQCCRSWCHAIISYGCCDETGYSIDSLYTLIGKIKFEITFFRKTKIGVLFLDRHEFVKKNITSYTLKYFVLSTLILEFFSLFRVRYIIIRHWKFLYSIQFYFKATVIIGLLAIHYVSSPVRIRMANKNDYHFLLV